MSVAMRPKNSAKRYLLCAMFLLGAMALLLGGLLVFLGGALLFVMIGLALGAGGLRLMRVAAVRARAMNGGPSLGAEPTVTSKLERRARLLYYVAAASTLAFWVPFVFGDPHFVRQFSWLVDGFFIGLTTFVITFVLLIGIRARTIFFKDSDEAPENARDVSVTKSNFLHDIKASKIAKRLRILEYVSLALTVVLFVLLFSIPKSSGFATWLLYGIVVAMGAYMCSCIAMICITLWKAIARTRDERRNGRLGSFTK